MKDDITTIIDAYVETNIVDIDVVDTDTIMCSYVEGDDGIIEKALRYHCTCGSHSQQIIVQEGLVTMSPSGKRIAAAWVPLEGGRVGVRIRCRTCSIERIATTRPGFLRSTAELALALNDKWEHRTHNS